MFRTSFKTDQLLRLNYPKQNKFSKKNGVRELNHYSNSKFITII